MPLPHDCSKGENDAVERDEYANGNHGQTIITFFRGTPLWSTIDVTRPRFQAMRDIEAQQKGETAFDEARKLENSVGHGDKNE